MNILVADDDKILSSVICAILSDAGHIAVPAYDSMQTMMFVMKKPPDLVVLDINMPGGTGLDVLRRLKMSSKTKAVPVVVLTANTDSKLPDEARALGATNFLMKPVDPDALLAAVQAAIL
ncbi:MAG: response regulator transcription factor [Gemmatimonadaceae bacterium]